MNHFLRPLLCALWVLAVSPLAFAQERVVTPGRTGCSPPSAPETVNPVYPQEALAQGIRGIVILEVLIDPQGKVASAQIIRSIPGLDEAALEAVRKWEYEVTKVDGQPVSVKLTVPITFAMKLPEVARAPGIPELRQGALVQYPAGQTEGQTVTAEVTLAPDGQVAEAEVVKGDAPFSIALLHALRTWRFAPEGEGVIVSFRVEADFVPAQGAMGLGSMCGSLDLRRSEAAPAPAADASTTTPDEAASTPTAGPPAAGPPAAAPAPPEPAPAVPLTETPTPSARETAPTATTPAGPAPVAPAPAAPAPAPAAPPVPEPPCRRPRRAQPHQPHPHRQRRRPQRPRRPRPERRPPRSRLRGPPHPARPVRERPLSPRRDRPPRRLRWR